MWSEHLLAEVAGAQPVQPAHPPHSNAPLSTTPHPYISCHQVTLSLTKEAVRNIVLTPCDKLSEAYSSQIFQYGPETKGLIAFSLNRCLQIPLSRLSNLLHQNYNKYK